MPLPVPTPLVVVLGSGTLFPDHTRHSAAHYVDLGSARILLDCGTGTLHALSRHGVPWQALTHVAITHYHNDHVGDVAALLFALTHVREQDAPAGVAGRTAPLTLIGPVGFGHFLERLGAAMGDHVLDPGFDLVVVEIGGEASHTDTEAGFSMFAHPTPHTDESVAYRIEGVVGTIGYTGDTGPSEAVAAHVSGCDVLIAECAITDPPEMDRHLSPAGLADMARIADPDLLVVTHVYPLQTPDQAVARIAEAGWPGRAVAAYDGLRVTLGSTGPTVDPPGTAV